MREDSQDVGSEAAIIERVRNSSLVECARTENVSRLKQTTEAGEARRESCLVGEHCAGREATRQRVVERAQERMPE